MQLILLFILSFAFAFASVWVSGSWIIAPRSRNSQIGLFVFFFIVGIVGTIIYDGLYNAGRPTFFYHMRAPGMATLKQFSIGCLLSNLWFLPILYLWENKAQGKPARVGLIPFLSKTIVICLLLAIIVEIFVFNLRHYELIGAEKTNIVLDRNDFETNGFYFNRADQLFTSWELADDEKYLVKIYAKNEKIRNIHFDFDNGKRVTNISLSVADEAFALPYEYGKFVLLRDVPRSHNIPLHTVGGVHVVEMYLPDVNRKNVETFSMPTVTLNQPIPMDIQLGRFGLTFFLLLLVGFFRPNSELYRIPQRPKSLAQLGVICMLLIGCCAWFNWTAFSSYSGSDDPIPTQKDKGAKNHWQYNLLVDALIARQYALLEQPEKDFLNIDRPYDWGVRQQYTTRYLWDIAFYKGQYYTYFGVVPALALLLPYKLLTGNYLEVSYATLIFCYIGLFGLVGVYFSVVRRWFRELSFGHTLAGLIMLISLINLTWCLRRSMVYEVAICSGFCFAVWGFFFLLQAFNPANRWLYPLLALSGVCLGLAIGCRPTLALLCIPAGLLLLNRFRETGKFFTARNLFQFLAFGAPYLLILLALMGYNYVRFDNPFEFGIKYQLTVANENTGYNRIGVWGALISFLSYFFTMPIINLSFPFIHTRLDGFPYNGFLYYEELLGLFSYPVLFFLFLLPKMKREIQSRGFDLWVLLLGFLSCSCLICLASSLFSITFRYMVDFAWLFGLCAIICLFVCVLIFEKRQMGDWINLACLICLMCGVALFLSVSVTGEQSWYYLINSAAFDKLRYAFEFWR